jgi:hypothetical protein
VNVLYGDLGVGGDEFDVCSSRGGLSGRSVTAGEAEQKNSRERK